MKEIEIRTSGAILELTGDELLILNNALNEVCNGIDLDEFLTRMGAEREEVARLLAEVGRLADQVLKDRG